MKLTDLKLVNFRNYAKREFKFEQKNVILGENGTGKTNILEAIYLLATGRSYRAGKEEEMILHKNQFSLLGFSSYVGQVNSELIETQITITDGTSGIARKKFEVNGVPRRMVDAVGRFRAVWFGPEDIEILTGSPSQRRKYLDFVLVQKDREYRRCLMSYEKGVRQRNRVLENIRDGFASRNQLLFWDKLLIKDGNYITTKREEYLDSLSDKYNVVYDKSIISESRLKQYEVEEVAAATTLVGPHRDDFAVLQAVNSNSRSGMDVAKYGSRGEQRMAVLWLKLGERDFLSDEKELPILLLDDIFSELDHKHRDEVMNLMDDQISSGGQVIMTTADPHMMPTTNWNIIQLEAPNSKLQVPSK